MTTDTFYMARALTLAKKGLYTTHPNPRVGCVLVNNGHIIAEGWHEYAGQAHAELMALQAAQDARGATAYVTLEPCSHHGKTPPCCDALIQAGVARVVAALQDPNPLVSGRGFAALNAAGIMVNVGVLAEEAALLNRGFISRMSKNKPFVRSKLAMSLDGRTALASGESKWITSVFARQDVQHLRAESTAILSTISTVLADNPALTARVDADVVQPIRVILDSQLRMPVAAQLAQQPGRTLVLTCVDKPPEQCLLERAGFEVYRLPCDKGRLDLPKVFAFLADMHINEVLVEAGAVLNGELLAKSLIDELVIYMSPIVLGDKGRGLFSLPGMATMAEKKLFKWSDVRAIGPDLRFILTPVET